MGLTKEDLFTEQQNELSKIAKVFAHPARIAIIDHLLSTNACINSDLVEELGLAQATISQHLKELKAIGIIQGSIEGTSMSYCIDSNKWNEVKTKLSEFFERFSDPCC